MIWILWAVEVSKNTEVSSPALIVGILGILIGGSGIAGWLTVRNQNKSLAVEAADNAVDAVNKALERIEKELTTSRAEVDRLQKALIDAQDKASSERGILQERINQLKDRVEYLESVVERYRRRAEDRGDDPATDYSGPERRTHKPGETLDE